MPSSANGMHPTSKVDPSANARHGTIRTPYTVNATSDTAATVAAAKTRAERTRPASLVAGPTGSVRRYDSQGVVLVVAIPTPNWKNATPRSAIAANPAYNRWGSPSSNVRPKRRRRIAGKAIVGTEYPG